MKHADVSLVRQRLDAKKGTGTGNISVTLYSRFFAHFRSTQPAGSGRLGFPEQVTDETDGTTAR